jgi:cytochrome c556
MKNRMLLAFTLATIACYATPTLADASDNAIKARQSYMQVVVFNARPLFGMIRGKVKYNAEVAQKSADNLKALASMSTGSMWPKGSDNAAKKGKTRAKPAIWENGSDVDKRFKAWQAAVTDLAGSAGGGLDALKSKVAAMGKECSGCHKAYRAKDF